MAKASYYETVNLVKSERMAVLLLELLVNRPYSSISVGELCRQMDVSRKWFYRHFACKEDLFLCCIDVLWRYFAWCNQTLAVFTLWALTVWLARERKCYWITLIPALFMTMVTITYILFAREGLRLPYEISLGIAFVVTLVLTVLFARFKRTLPSRVPLKK